MIQRPFLTNHKLYYFALSSLAVALFILADFSLVAAQNNVVVQENLNGGTTAWQLDNSADDNNLQIKGYASATSVNKGEAITLFVTTTPAQNYQIEIYRMGWYQGDGGRFITQISNLSGTSQSIPAPDSTTGLLALSWSPSYTLNVPTNWVSGVYLAKLTNASGYDNYIQFVVRDDNRNADILYQQSVTTYQAYNNFPENGSTGKSLYDYNSYGSNTISGSTQAVKVSFDRPYDQDGAGDFFQWEHDLIMWMERSGYDLSYSTNVDTHANGGNLLSYKAFVSTGHDEYWSSEMYDAAETARDQGVHLAFMGANAVYWQIRFEDSSTNIANRVIVSYQNAAIDPETDPAKETILFLDSGRPEQTLRGVTYSNFNAGNNTDLIVQNSGHWLYQNSGLADGDRVQEIVGYEVDTLDNALALPNNSSFDVLSSSPFVAKNGSTVTAHTVLFRAPSGAWVFSSGTMSWSNALQDYWDVDSRIQQATANLFDRMVNSAAPIVAHPGEQDSVAGQNISLGISATDPNGGALTYWAYELPPGLTINPNSGQISGQIYAGSNDTWESSVTVSNGSELTTIFFTWTVNRPNAGGCQSGEQEAEGGRLYGNFVLGTDSGASNGENVEIWAGVGSFSFSPVDRVEYCFSVASAGNYRLKGWVYAPNGESDSVYVTIDDGYANPYQWTMVHNSTYQADYLNDINGVDPVTFYLSAGDHTIALHQHEDGIRIDKLALESASGTAPGVTISAPATGATFNLGDTVTLVAAATDAEDGNISGSINWYSSIDNWIGSGGTINVNGLQPGTHQLSASVTDSSGLGASDSITVDVLVSSGPPSQSDPIAPSGTINADPPTFVWTKADGATQYRLLVRELTTDDIIINQTFGAGEFSCDASTCTLTAAVSTFGEGDYYWQIVTLNATGYGPWSGYAYFSLENGGAPLTAPLQVSPLGQINSATPAFTWYSVAGATGYATEYDLAVYNSTTNTVTHFQRHTAGASGCSNGGTCTVQLSTSLPVGAYTWLVRALNSSDTSPWSVYP